MSADANRAVVRRFIAEVFNRGNLSVVDEVVAPGYVHYDPATGEMGSGTEGLERMLRVYREAFPDFEIRLDEQIATDDRVVERWTGHGTHQGAIMGIPPTGRDIRVSGISIHTLRDGRITETYTVFDTAGMLRQLGALPERQ
jgi:steroid delta-isomerase-like uncharacterized protein